MPSLTKLQLADTQPFSTTGVDNFGPVYVRNMFNRNDCEMRNVWVTLYTCASTRNMILDVVPSLAAESLIIYQLNRLSEVLGVLLADVDVRTIK